jgi:prepilin-type processing-associated H-X9-DG protein
VAADFEPGVFQSQGDHAAGVTSDFSQRNAPSGSPAGTPPTHPDGLDLPVNQVNPPWSYTAYYLGAKLNRFQGEAGTVLVLESEYANDFLQKLPTAAATGPVTLGLVPPLWAGGGMFNADRVPSFRHGNFKLGNFLFLDGHVDTLRPTDEVWSRRRYYYSSELP